MLPINRGILAGVLLGISFLSACSGSSSPEPARSPIDPGASGALATTLLSQVATPVAGQAAVHGVLIDKRTSQPPPETILYLERSMNHDVPPVLYGPLNDQPTTQSVAGGVFQFEDVPPGEYILVLYSPVDILYAQQPDGRAMLVQATANQVTDLGQVVTHIP